VDLLLLSSHAARACSSHPTWDRSAGTVHRPRLFWPSADIGRGRQTAG